MKKIWILIVLVWETIKYYLVPDKSAIPPTPPPSYKKIIFTEGYMPVSDNWKEVRRFVFRNDIYIVFERVYDEIKEVRWFVQKNNTSMTIPVSRGEIEKILSV